MNVPGTSQQEARQGMNCLLSTKHLTRVGSWNVRTLYESSKLRQVLKEMERYKLDILGISECRWTGSGKMTSQGHTVLYSGRNEHTAGVAIIISKKNKKSLLEWNPIDDRIITARFNSKYTKITVIQCYAPTNPSPVEDKDRFYEVLQKTIDKVPKHDVLIVMGDLNAKVGADNTGCERIMGKHGPGTVNENGDRFIEFCTLNDLMIGGTVFPHKEIHKLTWVSPNKEHQNQIDHFAINNKWRSSLQDVRSYRGADMNSDHFLIIGKLKLKLRSSKRQTAEKPQRFDVQKLKYQNKRTEFILELHNRFEALQDLPEDEGIESQWNSIKTIYTDTAESTLGYHKPSHKEWISEETWEKIEERKKLRAKILSTENVERRNELEISYQDLDRQVKRKARKDKRIFTEELANEAEQAAKIGNSSKVYKITKKICGRNFQNSKPIKDKNGNTLTNEKEQAARWTEHFKEVLNQPSPAELPTIEEDDPVIDLNTDPPSKDEIKKTIKALKKNKAPGVDSIQAELLQANTDLSAEILCDFMRNIWNSENIPNQWQKGLIVKIPKKGDLGTCDNWRGITLLSIPSKIFTKILLNRIENEIDKKLREEQAGFRRNGGCIDQIFTLRNIIEQCTEFNEELHLNFIDFRKAFDSLDREVIWRILRKYGLPEKIINLIKLFYVNYECSVILEDKISEWFSVKTGVRQGCILSPILFLITIDWIMRQTCDQKRGIQWTLFDHLEDLDFADDLALLSRQISHLQEKTAKLSSYAAKTGLQINLNKTKTMHINRKSNEKINIDDQDIEAVEDFTYLGSILSVNNGAEKDIKSRLQKARTSFSMRSNKYSRKTKPRIFKNNVLSVLLYGSECWRMTATDISKLETFQNKCLRQICKIFYPNIISNRDLLDLTKIDKLEIQIKKRRHRLIGHIMRMQNQNIPKVALKWNLLMARETGADQKPLGGEPCWLILSSLG